MLKVLLVGFLLAASVGCKPGNCAEVSEQHRKMVRAFESVSPETPIEAAKLLEMIGADPDKKFAATSHVAGEIVTLGKVAAVKNPTPEQRTKFASLRSRATSALVMSKSEIEAVCN